MESQVVSDTLSDLMYGLVKNSCQGQGLSCVTWEIGKAVALPAAIVTGAAAISALATLVFKWNTDVREHVQLLASRQQLMNMVIVASGLVATAIAAIKLGGASVGLAAAGVFLPIWGGVTVALVMNHMLHRHMEGRHFATRHILF